MTVPSTRGYGQIVSDETPKMSRPPLSLGAVVGITCGVAVAVLLLAGIVVWFCCRKKGRAARAGELPRATQAPADVRVPVADGPERRPSGVSNGSAAPAPRASGCGAAAGGDAPGPSCGSVSDPDARCRMCRAAAYGGDSPAVLLECGHSFHRRCIRRWMPQNLTCPNCNTTHIVFIRGFSGEASHSGLQPRLSVDGPGSGDDAMEVRRTRYSRF